MRTRRIAAFVCLIAAVAAGAAFASDRRTDVADPSFERGALTDALEALRDGDHSKLSALPKPNAASAAILAEALDDPSDDVRRGVVTLLGLMDDPAAAPALARATNDDNDDVAKRAAAALYELGPAAVAEDPSVAVELQRAVTAGTTAGGAILMLAHAPDAGASVEALETLRAGAGGQLTEVFLWSPVVPVTLAADVSLAKLGREDAADRLGEAIEGGDRTTREFLLSVLREIDDAEILSKLAKATFEDERLIDGDESDGEEVVRLRDAAAVHFAKRFDLKRDFGDVVDRRLPDEAIQGVREAVEAALATRVER